MALTRLQLENFTAFESLDLELSPGINVFVGANGTGKTHIMKVCYAACDVSKKGDLPYEKLVRVFLPSGLSRERLVKRQEGSDLLTAKVCVHEEDQVLIETEFPSRTSAHTSVFLSKRGDQRSIETTYIPTKDMLANAPGFRSLYNHREIHFEEVYTDILDRAYLPPLRIPENKHLLGKLQASIGGEVVIKGEEFFLQTEQGLLEFTLLAEGFRKLGLLWLLIRNGVID